MYLVQINKDGVWITILTHSSEDGAARACYRAVFAYKVSSRVIGEEHQEVVCERFYNIAEDPDENWRDEVIEHNVIDWKDAGF